MQVISWKKQTLTTNHPSCWKTCQCSFLLCWNPRSPARIYCRLAWKDVLGSKHFMEHSWIASLAGETTSDSPQTFFSTPAFNTPGRCELPAARRALLRGVQWRCLDVCPLIQVHCGCPKTWYFQFCWFNIYCLLCAASLDKTLVADMTFWIAKL